jgi:hypothetical protein
MAKSNNITIKKGRQLFKSKAFISLTGKSTQVYCILVTKRVLRGIPIGKRKDWVITNNGEIQFTYDEAEEFGISRDKFRHGIDQLAERGFINVISERPLKFEFIDNWEKYGKNDFEPGVRNIMPVLFKKPQTENEKREFISRFNKNIEKGRSHLRLKEKA